MDNFSLIFKKYSLPAIFLVLGVGILYVYITDDQSSQFLVAGLLILLGAVFSLIHVLGKSTPLTNWAIGGVSMILALYAAFSTFQSVSDTQNHQENYRRAKLMAERNLQDLRTIQTAFNKKYGKYADSWEQLMEFTKSDFIWEDDDEGSVPSRRITPEELEYLASIKFTVLKDGEPLTYKKTQAIDNKMTEKEAIALCGMDPRPNDLIGFKRDSIKVSFIETTFTKNQSYTKERMDNDLGPFNVENLKIIPMGDGREWDYNFKQLIDADSNTVSYIRIGGLLPFSKYENGNVEEIFFGDTLSPSLKGSWEDEK